MQPTRRIAYGGMLAVLVLITTAYLRIPSSLGYLHVGDGAIHLAAVILGPYAGLAAAVGSGLADLLAGFPVYILATAFIKGLLGTFSGWYLIKRRTGALALVFFLLLEGGMVGCYFLFEMFLYGTAAATGSVLLNILQGIAGAVLGYGGIRLIDRSGWNKG